MIHKRVDIRNTLLGFASWRLSRTKPTGYFASCLIVYRTACRTKSTKTLHYIFTEMTHVRY